MTGMMKLLKTFAVQKFRCGEAKKAGSYQCVVRYRMISSLDFPEKSKMISGISLLLVINPEGRVQFFYTPVHLFTHHGIKGFLAAEYKNLLL